MSIKLEFLTDDPELHHLCELFWEINPKSGHFAFTVAQIADMVRMTPTRASNLARKSCRATSTLVRCTKCNGNLVYVSRNDYGFYEHCSREWICENCQKEEREARRAEIEARKSAKWEKRNDIIATRYSSLFSQHINLQTLSFERAVYLLSFAKVGNPSDDFRVKSVASLKPPLAPTKEYIFTIIQDLEDKKLISIHPASSQEAFEFNDSDQIIDRDVEQVIWRLAIRNAKQTISEIQFLLGSEANWPDNWHLESEQLWREIALHECLQYLEFNLDDYLHFNPGEKTISVIRRTLENYSVSQTYRIIWRAVKDAATFHEQRDVTNKHAVNTIPGSIERFVSNALENGWQVEGFNRDKHCQQSVISSVLFNVALKIGDDGFYKTPPAH